MKRKRAAVCNPQTVFKFTFDCSYPIAGGDMGQHITFEFITEKKSFFCFEQKYVFILLLVLFLGKT